jgi:hypothetical protein
MKIEMVKIGPALAAEYLTKNENNRNLSDRAVEILAKAMLSGEWISNGDTISFSGGKLIDGQHRLNAIIRSGATVDAIVVHDLPADAFKTKDIGKKRSTADSLTIMGEKNSRSLAAAISAAMMIEDEWFLGVHISSSSRYSVTEIASYLDAHQHAREVCTTNSSFGVGKQSIRDALQILAINCGQDATEFCARVVDGVGLAKNSPAYALRELLLKDGKSGKSISKRWEAAMWIKCFVAYRDGRPISLMRYKDLERFPKISDDYKQRHL